MLNSLYLFIFLVWNYVVGHSWNLDPLHRNSGVGLYKVVSEFLIGRCGAQSLSRAWG